MCNRSFVLEMCPKPDLLRIEYLRGGTIADEACALHRRFLCSLRAVEHERLHSALDDSLLSWLPAVVVDLIVGCARGTLDDEICRTEFAWDLAIEVYASLGLAGAGPTAVG